MKSLQKSIDVLRRLLRSHQNSFDDTVPGQVPLSWIFDTYNGQTDTL